MKKVFIAILAILYLGTSSGATVHLHYCMGKLVDSGIWNSKHTGTAKCDNCGMLKGQNNAKKCCKDEERQVKPTDNHKAVQLAYQLIQSLSTAVPSQFFEFTFINSYEIAVKLPFSHAPPRSGSAAIYIYNSTFLI
ncbi:MAG: hypothetical protein V4539_14090 [Bacteroidota bacterium]